MKRLLPVALLFYFLLSFGLFLPSAWAQPASSTIDTSQVPDGTWVKDPQVTFVGKSAARSSAFLDWSLKHYDWICVKQVANHKCDNRDDPLMNFWITMRNIVYAFSVLFVLIAAIIIVVTRGRSLTIMRFLPRFLLVIVLITFSFSLIQFIYQLTDIVQGFFLMKPPNPALHDPGGLISSKDLLYVGFDYKNFEGFRLVGSSYNESAFITLLLTRLTAFTYYAMSAVLLVRKIILWFFIVLSPLFPVLLLYSPVRNTAKLWFGEFLRWLLYAPLFAVLLAGLVSLWQSNIPLPFNNYPSSDIVYQTAVNILLAGPKQQVAITNSLNTPDTFALYVVALIMLWVVIILPFLLLKIFLDNLFSLSLNTELVHEWFKKAPGAFGRSYTTPPPPPQPSLTGGSGLARSLPFGNKFSIPTGAESRSSVNINNYNNYSTQTNVYASKATQEVLRLANLSVPNMRDIARFESAKLNKDTRVSEKTTQMQQTLRRIANPQLVTSPAEKYQYSSIKDKLLTQKREGNPLAASVLAASEQVVEGKMSLQNAAANQAVQKSPNVFPVINRVQSVSLDDYEAVKKMWVENYEKADVPVNPETGIRNRHDWVKKDMEEITKAITLLSSTDQEKVKEGMKVVSGILPFLLIGGFSQTEVIAYLKAKLEAGKEASGKVEKEEEEEETKVEAKHTEGTKAKEQEAALEVPVEENKTEQNKPEPFHKQRNDESIKS